MTVSKRLLKIFKGDNLEPGRVDISRVSLRRIVALEPRGSERALLQGVLECFTQKIMIVSNQHDLLSYISRYDCDLVLINTDIGREDCRQILLSSQADSMAPKARFVAMSAGPEGLSREEILRWGFFEILRKPLRFEEIRSLIDGQNLESASRQD